MNYHRKEIVKVQISDFNGLIDESDTNTRDIDIKALNTRLNKFAKLTPDNAFHVAVFKYIHYGGVKVAPLSRITGVNRRRLQDSKDFMNLKVKQWLKEEQRKQALRDWVTP